MKFKRTGAEKSTITRNVNDFVEKTGNVFKAVSILSSRSKQINEKMKEELLSKLEEFALDQEQLDEVFENQEQIAVSKFYESFVKINRTQGERQKGRRPTNHIFNAVYMFSSNIH